MIAGISKKQSQTFQSWKTIADGLARTLNHFAESNYERIIALR
jgi:hypothetical protein